MPQIRKNTLQDAKSYGIIVWLITAQKMQRYRSGHNGADSKSCRPMACLIPQTLDFTWVLGLSTLSEN